MKQFVLVPVCVYITKLTFLLILKQEPPEYQAQQNPSNHIKLPEREVIRKLFDIADLLVDRFISCPRIRLAKS